MWPVATDDPMVWFVSQSVTQLHFTKTAEQIEVLVWLETLLWGKFAIVNCMNVAARI